MRVARHSDDSAMFVNNTISNFKCQSLIDIKHFTSTFKPIGVYALNNILHLIFQFLKRADYCNCLHLIGKLSHMAFFARDYRSAIF